MKHHNKLSREGEHEIASELQAHAERGKEFASAEELLRYDTSQTNVPPEVAQRLKKSLSGAEKQTPWWKKLFGR